MKKKLFTLALIVSLYSVFTLAFTTFDNQGKIGAYLSNVGLTDGEAIASVTSDSDLGTGTLRRPMPKPRPVEKPSSPPQLN